MYMTNRFRAAIRVTDGKILPGGKMEKLKEDNMLEKEESQAREMEPKEVEGEENLKSEERLNEFLEDKAYRKIEYVLEADIPFDNICDFLRQSINKDIFELRIIKLKHIINALIKYKDSHKPVMLCDNKANIPYWISAVKEAFPRKIWDSIIFRRNESKEKHQWESCTIFIDDEEESVNSESYSEEKSAEVFNFIKGSSTSIKLDSKYSELVLVGYMLDEQVLKKVKNFLQDFNYNKLDTDIDSCMQLFYFLQNGTKNMDYYSIEKAMNFVDKYADSNACSIILEKMEPVITSSVYSIDQETAFVIICTMLNAAKKITDSAAYNVIYKFFYNYLHSLLMITEDNNFTHIYKFYNDFKSLSYDNNKGFYEYSLSNENISTLGGYICEADSKYAKFYLSVMLDAVKVCDIDFSHNGVLQDFMAECAEKLVKDNVDIKTIVLEAGDNINYISSLLALYYTKAEENKSTRNKALKLYMDIIEQNGERANEIRNIVFRLPKGKDIIFDEFIFKLAQSKKKEDFFWEYCTQVFENIRGFNESYFSEILQGYLNLIKETAVYKDECIKIIDKTVKNEIEPSNNILQPIIEDFENSIPLSFNNKQLKLLVLNLSQVKNMRNIKTSTNISRLVEYGVSLETVNSNAEFMKLINENLPEINNISDTKYKEFLEWTIGILIANKYIQIADILNYYKKVTAMKENGFDSFVEYSFSMEKINSMSVVLDSMKPKQIQFYMLVLIEYLIRKNYHWKADGAYEKLLSSCVNSLSAQGKEIYKVLDSIEENREFFANILVTHFSSMKENHMEGVSFFIEKSSKNGEDWTSDIRLYISNSRNGYQFLINEFKGLLDRTDNKAQFFWKYYSTVFEAVSDYKSSYFSEAFCYYLQSVEGTERYTEECINILEFIADDKVTLSSKLLGQVIKEYEGTIPLLYPTTEAMSVIEEIEGMKVRNKIIIEPNVAEIIRLGIAIQSNEDSKMLIEVLKNTKVRLNEVSAARYEEYLNWCLPYVFSRINILENANMIKRVFYIDKNKFIFNKIYNTLLMILIHSGTLAAGKNDLVVLLKEMKFGFDELSSIVLSYYVNQKEKGSTDSSIGLFIDLIDGENLEKALEFRKYMSSLQLGNEVLFEEYKYNLNIAANTQRFFWNYLKNVFNQLPTYKLQYFEQAIGSFLDCMEGTQDYPKACNDLLAVMNSVETSVNKTIETRILSGCELQLSLTKTYESQQDLIKEIQNIKLKRGINTSPNMVGLVKFANDFEKIKDINVMNKLLNGTELQLDSMDITKYEELLDFFLPNALLSVNSWQQHAVIKKAFCTERRSALFFTKYLGVLADNVENERMLGSKIFAEFVIYFLITREQYDDDLYVQVKTLLANILYRMSGPMLKDINNSVITETSDMKNIDIVSGGWENIYSKAISSGKQESGIFAKIFDRK